MALRDVESLPNGLLSVLIAARVEHDGEVIPPEA